MGEELRSTLGNSGATLPAHRLWLNLCRRLFLETSFDDVDGSRDCHLVDVMLRDPNVYNNAYSCFMFYSFMFYYDIMQINVAQCSKKKKKKKKKSTLRCYKH